MAKVYLARDRFLGRQVAVKILHPSLSGDARFLARFRREAEAAGALNHPHIVSIYDVGHDDEVHYIIMEYVEGLDLKELLVQNGPLPLRRAADIGAQAASALHYAHEHGLVHRDVKPHNIMIGPAGLVKVADFGIAKVLSEMTVGDDAGMLGTVQYVSPEQVQGGTVTPRSDIYSLGVVLYEAVTGFVPFPGDNAVSVALAQVQDEPVPPSMLHTDVTPEFEAIIQKAMRKNPKERYATADELASSLQSWTHATFEAAATPAQPGVRKARGTSRAVSRGQGCITWTLAALLFALLALFAAAPWLLDYVSPRPHAAPAVLPTPTPIVIPVGPGAGR